MSSSSNVFPLALAASLLLLAVVVVQAQDPPYDHQTTTYKSQFKPYSVTKQASLMPFFSPDHSIQTYVYLIGNATESIDLYTPGFSSWSGCTSFEATCVGCTIQGQQQEQFPVFPALLNAVHNGVKVRIVTNNYNTPTCQGKIAPLDFLALNGVQIRYYTTTTFMHTKYLAIDGKQCSVSSVNFSFTSFMKNREAGIVFGEGTEEEQAFYASVFEYDFNNGDEYTVGQKYSSSDMQQITSTQHYPVTIPSAPYISGAYVTPTPTFVTSTMPITSYTSPDFAFQTLMNDLSSATSSFQLMIYQITSTDLCNAIQAMKGNVTLKILVSDKIFDETDWKSAQVCYQSLYNDGITIRKTPKYYSYSHQKFWIVDGQVVGLSSGNYSPTDFPDTDVFPPYGNSNWTKANRDFNVHVEDSGVVSVFQTVLDEDYQRGSDWAPYSDAGVELVSDLE